MRSKLKSVLGGHLVLNRFQLGRVELDDFSADRANHVIVMLMLVIVLEVRAPVAETRCAVRLRPCPRRCLMKTSCSSVIDVCPAADSFREDSAFYHLGCGPRNEGSSICRRSHSVTIHRRLTAHRLLLTSHCLLLPTAFRFMLSFVA